MRGQGSAELEIDVYDVIGDSWSGLGVSAKSMRRLLRENPSAKSIKLRINSEGGDVFDGFAIYNLLKEHQATVHVQIDALAASMASVVAMAGNSRSMAANAFLMIHNPWGSVSGKADELRNYAEVLDKMRENMVDVYVQACGGKHKREDVLAAMEAETWYTAAEAKALGYIDTITGEVKMAASLDLSAFNNVPAALASLRRTALPTAPQTTPPTRAEGKRNMKTIALALRIQNPDTASEAEIVASVGQMQASLAAANAAVNELVTIAGAPTVEAAKGVIVAALAAREQTAKLTAELETIRAEKLQAESDALLATLRAEGKITPAQEKGLWPALSLEGRKAFASTAVRVLGADAAREGQTASEGTAGQITHEGKTWAQLEPAEKHNLHQTNRALYDSMKADFQRRNAA